MATTRITRRELLCENIVHADRVAAETAAMERIEQEYLVLAPYTYAQLREANVERKMGALLAELPARLVRAQAVRFLIERKAATGAAWVWGDVDAVAATFVRLASAWQAEQRALAQLELAQAVHADAAESAESAEEFRAAEELHGAKADVYFERRLIRERLERLALSSPPVTRRTTALDHDALIGQRGTLDGITVRIVDTTQSSGGTIRVAVTPIAAHCDLDGWFTLDQITL